MLTYFNLFEDNNYQQIIDNNRNFKTTAPINTTQALENQKQQLSNDARQDNQNADDKVNTTKNLIHPFLKGANPLVKSGYNNQIPSRI